MEKLRKELIEMCDKKFKIQKDDAEMSIEDFKLTGDKDSERDAEKAVKNMEIIRLIELLINTDNCTINNIITLYDM